MGLARVFAGLSRVVYIFGARRGEDVNDLHILKRPRGVSFMGSEMEKRSRFHNDTSGFLTHKELYTSADDIAHLFFGVAVSLKLRSCLGLDTLNREKGGYALHSRLPHILWLADPPTAHVLYHL